MGAVFDEATVRALLAEGKNREAASLVIRALGPRIALYLRRTLRDEDDVQDAMSEWSEHVWRGLPSFRFECSLLAWAYKLAHRAALHLLDEAWRRRGRRLETGEASALADEVRRTSLLLDQARAEKLNRLRELLGPEDRALLGLRLDQELSWREISEVLGGTEVGLRQRFGRIKERLGRLARKEGLLQ
jgi:RNA polymerase sigma-70 factor, ECF subfamily